MINWRTVPDDEMPQLKAYGQYYKTAMVTNKFLPSTPKNVISDENLSDAAKAAIDKAMPFYVKLKELSYKPST